MDRSLFVCEWLLVYRHELVVGAYFCFWSFRKFRLFYRRCNNGGAGGGGIN